VLAYLLGSRLRAKLLGLLMTHPDERFYVRQISYALNENSTNVSRELTRLADKGILTRITEGRQAYYQADPRCPIYSELRGLAVKTTGLCYVLRDALAPMADRIRAAFVYGSFAGGHERAASDVDVMIVGGLTVAEVVKALRPAQETLGREINPVVYPSAEFAARVREGHHFVARVMSGEKLFLLGDDDELARVAREPVAE